MRIYNYQQRLIFLSAVLILPIVAHAQIENIRAAFDTRHLVVYLIAAFLISVLIMMFYNRVYYYREKQMNIEAERMNAQLAMILESSKMQTWTYDVNNKTFTKFSEHGRKETIYIPFDFSQFYDHEDFKAIHKIIQDICNWESRFGSLTVKSAPDKEPDKKQHIYNVTISILRYDQRNKPIMLLGTQQDITEDEEKAKKTRDLALMYHTVFNTSLIDMIYFDANGVMTEINDKVCESLHIKDKQALIDSKLTLADMPSLKGVDFKTLDKMYSSSFTKVKDIEKPMGNFEKGTEKIYYEQHVTTIHDHQGHLSGVVLAGRDVSDMVLSQHRQKNATKQLKETTEAIESYIRNINYSLKVSDVRLMYYDPNTHVLEVSSDLKRTQYRMTQVRALSLIKPEMHRRAKGILNRMDNRKKGAISMTLETILHDNQGRHIFLNFNLMPITNKQGEITHYFGMCRNETEMTYTEMKLQEEQAKAQETEQLKNSFLLNMSYELRTPLNAVIGFAGLFNSEHSEEDEPVFAEEIRKNTGTLLQLINDILFISRLDARMIEHNYQLCDFALLFDGWCYMGWTNIAPNVKIIVENPYNQLLVNIDQQNLAMVIEKLCTISSKHTLEGSVRAKYEYRHGELMISIEDTGQGLSAEALSKFFDRFVRYENVDRSGTGLDMPIVKELVEQMNGTIEVQSELGKGTSFYISIPCEMASFEKKTEILI
jgi:signal transduction histidine kinase/PAS domain-containing protein